MQSIRNKFEVDIYAFLNLDYTNADMADANIAGHTVNVGFY